MASSLALCMTLLFTLLAWFGPAHACTHSRECRALLRGGGFPPACICFSVSDAALPPTHPHGAVSEEAARYGAAPMAWISADSSLYADQAIVVHLLNPGAMGIYVVALSLSRTLNVIHQAVAAVLFPKAVALERHELMAMTGRAIRVSTLCTTACGALVALFGPLLLTLLYGREYRGATMILNILIAEVILTGATLVLTRAYMALNRPGLVTALQSSGLLLSLPLLAIFVPKWGVLGASFALLTAAVVRLGVALASFRFVLGQPAPGLIPRVDELQMLARRMKSAGVSALRRRTAEAAGV